MKEQDAQALYLMVTKIVTKARNAVSSPAGEKMMQVRKDVIDEARGLLARIERTSTDVPAKEPSGVATEADFHSSPLDHWKED